MIKGYFFYRELRHKTEWNESEWNFDSAMPKVYDLKWGIARKTFVGEGRGISMLGTTGSSSAISDDINS